MNPVVIPILIFLLTIYIALIVAAVSWLKAEYGSKDVVIEEYDTDWQWPKR